MLKTGRCDINCKPLITLHIWLSDEIISKLIAKLELMTALRAVSVDSERLSVVSFSFREANCGGSSTFTNACSGKL